MTPEIGVSPEAGALYAELQADGLVIPEPGDIQRHRQQTRAGFEPYVVRALEQFDGDIDEITIAGVACMQLTPRAWPADAGGCIQYAYGGGFVCGSPWEDLVIAAPLATLCGARVVLVDYRLSPEHPYPLPQRDMQAVYPELLGRYGAPRLALAGESAGGNQALGLLQFARDQGFALPACAALLSPWCDLGNRGDSHEFNDGRDPTLSQAWVEIAAALHAGGQALEDPGISPLYGEMRDLPPLLITSGSRDLLLSQSLRLARQLRAAGVDCELRVWEQMWHVFEFYPIPEARRSLAEIAAFIAAKLPPRCRD